MAPGRSGSRSSTPHRYFPVESHTTGLPLLNYLPARIARTAALRFSKRIEGDESWDELLRKGIRGGTEMDILHSLGTANRQGAVLLKPKAAPSTHRSLRQTAKHAVYSGIGAITGTSFGPWVRMAVRKV
jgi:hypothetical protein